MQVLFKTFLLELAFIMEENWWDSRKKMGVNNKSKSRTLLLHFWSIVYVGLVSVWGVKQKISFENQQDCDNSAFIKKTGLLE